MPFLVITGPESTGKTTLAAHIAGIFQCTLTTEYARTYLAANGPEYTLEDVLLMAKTQLSIITDAIAAHDNLICDTDLMTYLVWCNVRFGHIPTEIQRYWEQQQKPDCYYLCKPDIPWQEDPLRENPTDRPKLFEQYEQLLKAYKLPYEVVHHQC